MGLFDGKDNDKAKDKKKPKADFSNVRSGSATAPAPPRPPARPKADFSRVESGSSSTAPTVGETEYVVRSGDSLSKIAKRLLGNANRWREIYDANRETIGGNPDLIHPGQKLVIPKS
jgi:nucleoid-associated protein YgaU